MRFYLYPAMIASLFQSLSIPFLTSSQIPYQHPSPHLPHLFIYISSLPSASSLSSIIFESGPFLTIKLITSYRASAAAIVVCSALVSYAGATSTISAAMRLIPSSPLRIVRSSRVDQPPVSGVPVAGATEVCQHVRMNRKSAILQAGSRVSMSIDK